MLTDDEQPSGLIMIRFRATVAEEAIGAHAGLTRCQESVCVCVSVCNFSFSGAASG